MAAAPWPTELKVKRSDNTLCIAFDSGERERFRTRIERVNGHTEVYITHQQMLQKLENNTPDALAVWTNGKPDPMTLHAGMAPTSGEKWLFSQWIRQAPAGMPPIQR